MDDAPSASRFRTTPVVVAYSASALLGAALALAAARALAPFLLERIELSSGDWPFLAAVALAGAALGVLVPASFGLVRTLRHPADEPPPAHDPAAIAGGLHLVAGGARDRVARAVCELVAHGLARDERVVVVDTTRAFRLHRPLGLSARLGFVECMAQGQPALGLLQSGGFTGLFLLARGRTAKLADWLPIDRVLEELRPHFDRVILAFDPQTPAVVGSLLAGRLMHGWWAGPGSAGNRAAVRASNRLAIALSRIELAAIPKASLEAIEARLVGFARPEPAPPPPVPIAPGPPLRFLVSPPAVLDCDLQIRQKLRFLAWMRRMRTEHDRAETAGRR